VRQRVAETRRPNRTCTERLRIRERSSLARKFVGVDHAAFGVVGGGGLLLVLVDPVEQIGEVS
jgi:hypothetical protein